MANREKGEVSLQVGETSYTLVLSINGILEAEDAASQIAGHPMQFDEIGTKVSGGSIRYLRLVVWALLRKYHRDMTVEQVGDLIDEAGGLVGMQKVITSAIGAAAPDPVDVETLSAGKTARPRTARANGSGGKATSPRVVSA